MSDQVIGIAVLDEASGRLFIVCHTQSTGRVSVESIPAYPQGHPKPAAAAWSYVERGDILHVNPSVKLSTTNPDRELFHNAASWTVKFFRYAPSDDSDAWSYCAALNKSLIDRLRSGRQMNEMLMEHLPG
jgi:hypothetical protein